MTREELDKFIEKVDAWEDAIDAERGEFVFNTRVKVHHRLSHNRSFYGLIDKVAENGAYIYSGGESGFFSFRNWVIQKRFIDETM